MNNITFKQLPQITGGDLIYGHFNSEILDLITDSRKANPSRNSVFFAIQGIHQDGHKFISELYEKGCRQFIIEKKIDFLPFSEGSFLIVDSAIRALQKLVAFKRDLVSLPVFGITGSNGKTIVKEWLAQLLSEDYNIIKSPGSYNSQLGVPLSVWQISNQHNLGIFEAGISRVGEMEKLEMIIKPSIGIFTNALAAHDEGFDSRVQKVKEKAKLFSNSETIIYCKDHELIDNVIREMKPANQKLFTWGFSKDADILISKINLNTYRIQYHEKSMDLSKEFADAASWQNLFHCTAAMIQLDYSFEKIKARTSNLKSLPMRLELKAGVNGSTIIDDSYSNDLAGLSIALDFFDSQRSGKGIVFLSDMLESGLKSDEWIDRINELLLQHRIEKLVAIGPIFKENINKLTTPRLVFDSVEDCLKNFPVSELTQATVLIKGARSFKFEQIVRQFQRKIHGTIMEIDLNSISHNLNVFRSKLKPETKIMAMVKAFGYGSGSNEVASVLQYHKVDYLGVAYPDEGKWLRSKGIHLPIMVMNPSIESLSTIIDYNLEPSVFSISLLRSLVSHIQGAEIPIHLKLDTGMHRLGFEVPEISNLIQLLKKNKNIKVKSVYSHLSGSDESIHDGFTTEQVNKFNKMVDQISAVIQYPVLKHILNTAGISRFNQYQYDMVRLGIGLYGVDPGNELNDQLIPAVTLQATVSQVKEIKKGETVGYGRHGKSDRSMKIATISIGYADGFSRAFSKGVGKVLIKNKLAAVIGNVCMDMTMVDVTGIEVKEGDDVIIFGKDLPVSEVATWINTIPYEILTNTSDRVKRIFVAESV